MGYAVGVYQGGLATICRLMTSGIILYPFQERGLNEGRAHYRRGKRAGLFVAPTGAGKTVLLVTAAAGRVARGGRVVVIAHRRELVNQTAETFARAGLDVGYQGRRSSASVQVTSIQTILATRNMPPADFAIFDEAHHYAADEWSLAPLEYLKAGARLMGVTATPERDDGRGLGGPGGIFDFLVIVAQVRELVELNSREDDKGITPIKVISEGPNDVVRKLATRPCDAYAEHTPNGHAVVFAPNVKNAYEYSRGFAEIGIEAPVIHGEMPAEERDEHIRRFATGEIMVLVNVNVLTEGWDAPICDVCILARKLGSLSMYFQCVGRARRARRGKAMSYLLDLSGNYALHGHPDEELVFSLEGAGISRGNGALVGPRVCRRCRYVLADAIYAARLAGGELTHCPNCGRPLSQIVLLTPEEIALQIVERDAARRAVAVTTRIKALATMYAQGIKAGHQKDRAHNMYRGTFKAGFPTSEVRAKAWNIAVDRIAAERGDAWDPGEEAPGLVDDRDPMIEHVDIV